MIEENNNYEIGDWYAPRPCANQGIRCDKCTRKKCGDKML